MSSLEKKLEEAITKMEEATIVRCTLRLALHIACFQLANGNPEETERLFQQFYNEALVKIKTGEFSVEDIL